MKLPIRFYFIKFFVKHLREGKKEISPFDVEQKYDMFNFTFILEVTHILAIGQQD